MSHTNPSGTVTFLFTDIEGSTRLWELYPEPMKAVLARHDAILTGAVGANQGRIVKMTGDGCYAVFDTAVGAVHAVLAAQQAFTAERWTEIQPESLRVRMALHTGEAEAREGDYHGPALNRAARLMSVGHGGQVLVSASTAELVRDRLPGAAELMDLGEHRLKDLVRPEHIYQLIHPSLPAAFSPLESVDAFPNNLPVQITSFIGREREIEEAKELLSRARLVTFTGSGGTGKTRLALQVGAEMLSKFADGVWLVELAPLADGNLVLPALAAVLELRPMADIPLLTSIADYLRGKDALVILDNCEHLIDACAHLADHLLRSCPRLKILASSREGLGIAGEVSYTVPSLSLPLFDGLNPDILSTSEAARLFVERARDANPRFVLTGSNTPAVAQICRRLDGIPLALELAAARMRLFTAEQVASRLNDRFRLLTGGSRTAVPRQQTLRAMIDWSYDLLSEPERRMLRQLSVFVGGWTYEAADFVCADLDVLTLLEQLINKSLVTAEECGRQVRYDMLETIRQYARDRLVDAGEAGEMRDRHLACFLRLSEEAEPGLRGSSAFEWLERLAEDADNIRAAIEWGQDQHPEDALLLLANLIFFWGFRADHKWHILETLRETLEQVTVAPGDDAPRQRIRSRARGLAAAGLLLMQRGDPAAREAFAEAIQLERKLDDPFYLAFMLGVHATNSLMIGDQDDGRAGLEESAALLRRSDDKRWLVMALPALATLESHLGHEQRAQELRDEVRQYLRQIENPIFLPSLLSLAYDAKSGGRPDEAEEYLQEGLRLARRLKAKGFIIVMESELAHRARERGELAKAKQAYRTLIWHWKDFGQVAAVAHQLECLAYIAVEEGEVERAVRLLGAAEALRESVHSEMRSNERTEHDKTVTRLRELLPTKTFRAAWSDGRRMDMDAAVRYAADAADPVSALDQRP